MSDENQITMRQWCVVSELRDKNNTISSAGTVPLHMYQKDIPVGEVIEFEDLSSEVASESQE